MKKISPRQLVIASASGAVCAFFSAGFTTALLNKGLGSAEVAGWVQAIGSISALAIAIYVSIRQSAHSAKLVADADKLTTVRRARSVAAVLIRAYDQVKEIDAPMRVRYQVGADMANAKRARTTDLGLLNELAASIKAVPAHDLGSYHMADGLLQISSALVAYRTALDFLIREPEWHGYADVIKNLDGYRKTMEDGLQKFNAGVDELGIGSPQV